MNKENLMLDLVGTLVIGWTVGTLFAAIIGTTGITLTSRLAIGGIAGAWVGLVAAAALSRALAAPTTLPILFSLPLLTVAALLSLPAARDAIFRIPVQLVIGLNAFRALGVLFLFLAAAGRLAGPFPYAAAIGDIITGLFALSIARIAARSSTGDRRVMAWNAFGMLDLIVAVTLGVTSQPGSPIQLIHAGVGSAAIITLPWAFVPLVGVPLYLIGHAIIFAHARQESASLDLPSRIDATQAS
jgi:hypothetical protein